MTEITRARFNTLQGRVDTVLGTGPNGYGQTDGVSAQRSAGDIIEADHINDIYTDLSRMYKHQTGGAPSATDIRAVNKGDLIRENDTVFYQGWAQYEALMTIIENNSFDIANGQYDDQTGLERSRGSWNGTIVQVFDIEFDNANALRHYFNSGGYIAIRSATSDSSSLGNSWQNMFNNNAGDVILRANGTSRTGSGGSIPNPALGALNLTTSYQSMYENYNAGGGAYSANDYFIEVQAPSDVLIKIRVTYRDEKGGNPDENVSNLTAACINRRADVDIIGTFPGVSSGSGTTL